MTTDHIANQAHKLIEIDKPMHWHLVCVREDGSAFTLHIHRSWTAAKESKTIMDKEDAERQWNSPVAVERFNYAVSQCWSERCTEA